MQDQLENCKTSEEKLDACIEMIGGFGKFQLFAFSAVSTGIAAAGFWKYELGYFMQEPRYSCTYTSSAASLNENICTAANICADDSRIKSWDIDWSHEASLRNWHYEFDLKCWPKHYIGLICSLFWLGWCCTLLWLPRLADVYGRKNLIAYNNFVSLALHLLTIFAPNIYVLGGTLFTWGLFNSIRVSTAFLYMVELMPKKNQNTVGTIHNCFDGSIGLFATIFFMTVSIQWQYFVYIGLIFQIYACFAVWFLPESPIFLLKVGRIDELKKALSRIAKWNGHTIDVDSVDFSENANTVAAQNENKKSKRRPDKAENVMKISGLPFGTDENQFRLWLG